MNETFLVGWVLFVLSTIVGSHWLKTFLDVIERRVKLLQIDLDSVREKLDLVLMMAGETDHEDEWDVEEVEDEECTTGFKDWYKEDDEEIDLGKENPTSKLIDTTVYYPPVPSPTLDTTVVPDVSVPETVEIPAYGLPGWICDQGCKSQSDCKRDEIPCRSLFGDKKE